MVAPPTRAELLELSRELDELGGGDARVATATVCARIRPGPPLRTPIVTAAGDAILLRCALARSPCGREARARRAPRRAPRPAVRACVRRTGVMRLASRARIPPARSDPRAPADVPEARAHRRYRVSPGGAFGGTVGNGPFFAAVGLDALDWLWGGFDVTIVAAGQAGSGKTYTLHGRGDDTSTHAGLIPRLGHALLERIADAPTPGRYALGLSACEVGHASVRDLLLPPDAAPPRSPPRAASPGGARAAPCAVEVRSAAELRRALAAARAASANWAAAGVGAGADARGGVPPLSALPNRTHAVFRLHLLDGGGGSRSEAVLTAVDLIGSAPAPAPAARPGGFGAAAAEGDGAGEGAFASLGVPGGGMGGVGGVLGSPGRPSAAAAAYERQVANKSLLAFSRLIDALARAARAGADARADAGAREAERARDDGYIGALRDSRCARSRPACPPPRLGAAVGATASARRARETARARSRARSRSRGRARMRACVGGSGSVRLGRALIGCAPPAPRAHARRPRRRQADPAHRRRGRPKLETFSIDAPVRARTRRHEIACAAERGARASRGGGDAAAGRARARRRDAVRARRARALRRRGARARAPSARRRARSAAAAAVAAASHAARARAGRRMRFRVRVRRRGGGGGGRRRARGVCPLVRRRRPALRRRRRRRGGVVGRGRRAQP